MARRAKKLVLVVDDDEQTRSILKKRLGLHGYCCIGATTADAGLEALAALEPDVVLLEIELAGGWRFLELAAAFLPAGHLLPPIIVVSCNDDQEVVRRTRRLGVAGFLAKPYDPDRLVLLIRSCIGEACRAAPERAAAR